MKKALLLFFALVSTAVSRGEQPADSAIQVTASFGALSGVVLSWPSVANSTYTVARKAKGATSWGTAVAASTTGYADTTVGAGEEYEYEVIRRESGFSPPNDVMAYGYIAVAVQKPAVVSRGKVILVVANTHAAALAPELWQLTANLMGDGWKVVRYDVDPHDDNAPQRVATVKGLIQSAYNADPTGVKSVLLIGNVPVPYSGFFAPDNHVENHLGAWVADTYYAEMNGSWTDLTDFQNATGTPNDANDGKFDQSTIPGGELELEIGRVDFAHLTNFSNKTPARYELDLLRAYLRRNHDFRHGNLTASRKGYIMDSLGWHNGDAFAATPLRVFTTFFGSGNVSQTTSDYIGGLIGSETYLWSFGAGGGGYTTMGSLYSENTPYSNNSSDWFAVKHPKAIFSMLIGSYFGDWNNESNLLRSGLASGDCLAVMWSGKPHWFVHWMRTGETIGQSGRLTANNKITSGTQPLYKSYRENAASWYGPNGVNGVHISLLGDPTLRMDIVKPVKNLRLTQGATTVTITWDASGDASSTGFAGYEIYKATSSSGTFTYQGNTSLTTYSQAKPASGNVVYLVKAAKWEGYDTQAQKGIYLNTSVGQFTYAYTVASIGTLPYGGTFSSGFAINSLGVVAGSGDTDYPYTDVEHAARKLPNGSLENIDGVTSKSVAGAINAAGVIVGYTYYYDTYGTDWRAFKWNPTANPQRTVLSELHSSSYYTEATSINVHGDLAGYGWNASAVNRALRWDGGTGSPVDLQSLDGPTSDRASYGYGINSAKRVVGMSVKTVNGSQVWRAFRTAGAGLIVPASELGTISGASNHSSEAQAINDFDEVVGASHNAQGEYHAFFRTAASGTDVANFTDLGTFGGNASIAFALNNVGQVVGYGRTTNFQGSEKAAVWMKGWSAMQDLNNLLPVASGWDLREATGINDAGQITGWGYYGYQRLGFILTPN